MMYILFDEGDVKWFVVCMLIIICVILVISLIVILFIMSKIFSLKIIEFYSCFKIYGRGWKKVRDIIGIELIVVGIKDNVIVCVVSIIFIYFLLFGIGNVLFEDWFIFGYYLIFIIVFGWVVKIKMLKVIVLLR